MRPYRHRSSSAGGPLDLGGTGRRPRRGVVRRGRDGGEETRAQHLRRCQAGCRAAGPDSRLATSKPAAATSSRALRLGRMQQPNQREKGRERVALLLRMRITGLLAACCWRAERRKRPLMPMCVRYVSVRPARRMGNNVRGGSVADRKSTISAETTSDFSTGSAWEAPGTMAS